MRPLNVIDLRDTYEVGGPGKTILETFRAIDASAFRLQLGVFARQDESAETPFVVAARQYGMPVHVLRSSSQYDPRLVSRLARLIEELEIDLVHAHEVKSDVLTYLASFIRPVPILTTLHGWIGNSPKQRVLIAVDKLVARRYDRVIAVSEKMRQELHDAGVPPQRVVLVHNAIVLENYRRTGQRGLMAEVVGRQIPGPVVVSIGRLSHEKGHADLIEALGQAASRGCRMSAVFAGDGPERPALERQIARLGLQDAVHLPGYLDRPQRLLEEADLSVLPSHTEGLPNAALEALAMEVPVLATRVGGTPDVITDGETGRLVEAKSPAALAAALMDFAADPAPWRQMAERGKAMVERRFDFRVRTQRMEELYLEMTGRRPAGTHAAGH